MAHISERLPTMRNAMTYAACVIPANEPGKQWGGSNKKAAGRELEGRVYDEMPVIPELV